MASEVITNDDRLFALYCKEAREAGCPPDQIDNFFTAELCLQPKQLRAAALARECDRKDGPTEIGYGGSRGGGKSAWSMIQLGADDCQRMPGLKCLLLRNAQRSARESLDDLRKKLLMALPHTYAAYKGMITFPNGSRILSGHFANERDIDAYLGIEYDVVVLEEATLIGLGTYLMILTCCRSSNPDWRPRIYTTTNPGGIGHCVPFGEVLTPDRGWVEIQDCKVGERVFTVDSKGRLSESHIEQVHAQHYEGDILTIAARGLHVVCTPEHRIAKVGGVRAEWNTRDGRRPMSLVKACELPGQATLLRAVAWRGKAIREFSPPVTVKQRERKIQPKKVTGDQYAELVGWFLSEGYTCKSNGAKWWGIAQTKTIGREKIKRLLDACGFKVQWAEHSAVISGMDWVEYWRQFGKCRDKYIPERLKRASAQQLRLLFNALVNGDGHWTADEGGSGQYYTISARLAADVVEVAMKLGYIVCTSERERVGRVGLSYMVNFKTTQSGGTEVLTGNHRYSVQTVTKRRSQVSRKQFAGNVYCIGVPETHSFVIRQNGSVWISGNSWYKKRFIEPYMAGKEVDTRFIPATVDDNRFLNDNYVKTLDAQTGWRKRAWRHGDWEIAAGQYFSAFSERHHIVDAVDERRARKWFGCFDYGFTHYTCCMIGFWDGDGEAWLVDEHFQRKQLVPTHANAIKSMIGRHQVFHTAQLGRLEARPLTLDDLDYFVAGTDIFSKKQDGKSVDDDYREHGIKMKAANTDRIGGAATLLKLMGDPDNKDNPQPSRLHIHRRCQNFIEQLTAAQHDPKHPEDTLKVDCDDDGNGGDDAYDCGRYGLHYHQQGVRMQKVRGM